MIKKYKALSKPGLLLIAGLMLVAPAWAQTGADVQQRFNNYAQNTVYEKLFVHADKNVYLAGELIWFKIYSVDAATHKPTDLSKVAYVEVLDKSNNAILQAKIAMTGGSGAGSFYIPAGIAGGTYKLRAYTNWMKNQGPDHFFEKQLSLINPAIAPKATATANPDISIQLFPEGGSLVNGFTSKVTFKVTSAGGLVPANVTGAVTDANGNNIVNFKPLKAGIGSFDFTPAAGKTYRVTVNIPGQKAIYADMPAAVNSGYAMRLIETPAGMLDITVTGSTANENLYLFAHTRNQPKVLLNNTLNSNTATFTIDPAKLGEGISHITVFNQAKQAVCERLYFKYPKQRLFVDAAADQQQYALRRKVMVDVTAKDTAGQGGVADMSLSVYRVDSLQQVDNDDILSYLWLQADVKGHIANVGDYFTDRSANGRAALDNLLLSQGWRRFKWDEVIKGKTASFDFLPEYHGHLVTARITNPTAYNSADKLAYLGIPGKMVQLYTAKADSTGKLLFNTKNFFGPGEIVVQTNSRIDSISRIEITDPFMQKYAAWNLTELKLIPAQRQAIEQQSLATQVLNVYSGDKLKRFYSAVADSSTFYGKPDKKYKLDDYTRFATLEEVFREYIPEVDITRRGKDFYLKMISKDGFLQDEPIAMLDGVPVFNITKLMAVDPLKINTLEDVRSRYFWGAAKTDGIIALTTYKGDLGGVEMDPNAVVIDYEGMQLQREFYSPVYDTDQQLKSRLPDLRNLLYWNPSVITGTTGSKLSFYTSDQPGSYIGVVQGITASGDAGYKYFRFEVRK